VGIRWLLAFAAVVPGALALGIPARDAPAGLHARCKLTSKIVNGRRKRVRVCKKTPMPQAGSIAATIALGPGVQVVKVVASDTAVWALSNDRRLFRIDPASNTLMATVRLPDSEWPENEVSYGQGSIWVTVASPDTARQPELDSVLRLDAQTLQLIARIRVGHSPEGIAFTPGAVWIANHRSEFGANGGDVTGRFDVSRVDPASNSEIGRVPVEDRPLSNGCCGPQGMTAAAGSLWITDPQESGNGLVLRIDPATNSVTARIPFAKIQATACGDLAGDDAALWVVSGGCNGRLLVRIDPRTNQVVKQIALGAFAQDVALGFGSVWVTTNGPFGNAALSGLNRINPATSKVAARTHLPAPQVLESGATAPLALAVGAGSIWVGGGNNVLRVTPR
jgi:DNA-binding beta-propeller fold protein YncE